MIRRKYSAAALLLAVMMILGVGCVRTESEDENKEIQKTVSLYFGNSDGTDLVEERLSVKDIAPEKIPEYVMEQLLDGPKKQENKRIIRAGTSLLGVSVEKGGATVNLSREFYNEESIMDVLASASIVKSLCSVRGIGNVEILIEGAELSFADDGSAVGGIKDNDLVFDADALMQDESNITLYFSDAEASCLVREIRRVKVPKGESMEKVVVSELIKGPQKEKTYKTIPQETKIRSVETKDGVCFVNLSSEFISKHSGGTAAELLTVYSIVNSLTELSNVEKVQFLIEGEKKDVFIHMVFNEPIARDVSMVQKS